MQGSPRLATLGAVLAVAACAPAPTPSTSVPPPTDVADAVPARETALEFSHGIAFERPTAWAMWQPNLFDPMGGGPLIYLSTDQLRASCAVAPEASPNPADDQGFACDWPLDAISPNGVLVTWATGRVLQPIPTKGEPIEIDGQPARIQVDKPGACKAVGADETIDVWVPIGQPTPLSNLGVFACLSGPDLASAEAQFTAMLRSTDVQWVLRSDPTPTPEQ
jgi:hypothetical protein